MNNTELIAWYERYSNKKLLAEYNKTRVFMNASNLTKEDYRNKELNAAIETVLRKRNVKIQTSLF